MANTTHLWGWNGSAYAICQNLSASQFGGSYSPVKYAWIWNGSAWEGRYSTPTLSVGNAVGSGSDVVPTGTVSATPSSVSVGGTNSGNIGYSWSYVSGSGALVINNSALSNPTWTATNMSAGTLSATWSLTITDNQTGATRQQNITVQVTYTNTWAPYQQVVSSSGTITVPRGSSSATIRVVAGGGGGGYGRYDIPIGDDFGGQGGGSGGYQDGSYSWGSGSWNSTFSATVGAGAGTYPAVAGSSSVSGGVVGGGLSASGGHGGISNGSSGSGSGQGGSPNGVNGGSGGDMFGGAGGNNGTGYGRGADGVTSGTPGNGDNGAIIINWS